MPKYNILYTLQKLCFDKLWNKYVTQTTVLYFNEIVHQLKYKCFKFQTLVVRMTKYARCVISL